MTPEFLLRARHTLASLRPDMSGLAMVEFAFMAPILAMLGMGGLELSNYAVAHLRISQAVMHIADNGSRIGDRDALMAQKIYEADINDIFLGVNLQAGEQMELFERGRVIVSSLEQNDEGGQWIHWQRCHGKLEEDSSYGEEGDGATGTGFVGMGRSGEEIQASPDQAVIFVEIIYEYEPLIDIEYATQYISPEPIRSIAAFNVRGTRDLSGIHPSPGSPVRTCDTYTAS